MDIQDIQQITEGLRQPHTFDDLPLDVQINRLKECVATLISSHVRPARHLLLELDESEDEHEAKMEKLRAIEAQPIRTFTE